MIINKIKTGVIIMDLYFNELLIIFQKPDFRHNFEFRNQFIKDLNSILFSLQDINNNNNDYEYVNVSVRLLEKIISEVNVLKTLSLNLEIRRIIYIFHSFYCMFQ